MGHRFSWISVAAKAPDKVLAELGLSDSGEAAAPGTAPAVGARLANGSYVLVFDAFQHAKLETPVMRLLSLDGFVVGCTEDEDANISIAFAYRDGGLAWQVAHSQFMGDDQLDVDGTAPRIVASLKQAALDSGHKRGRAAIFGVPAALAREVCDFRYGDHAGLRFTRLDARLADLDATLAEVVGVAAAVLAAEGYVRDAANPHLFVKATADDRIELFLRHETLPGVEAVSVGARIVVANHRVQGLLAQVPEVRATPTAIVGLHDGPVGHGHLATPAQVAEFTARLRGELPGFLRSLHDVVALDALVNDGRTRYTMLNEETLSQYDTEVGYSRLVLAWLAGNPKFEEMVAQTDLAIGRGKRDPASTVNRIRDCLRANATPGAGPR